MSSRGQAGWYSHISSAAAGHGFEWILQGERSCGIYRSGGPEMEQRTPHSSVYSKGGWEPATKESSERETWLFKSLLADCWSAQLLSSYKPMRSYHFSLQYCKKKKVSLPTWTNEFRYKFFLWELSIYSERKCININFPPPPPHDIPIHAFFPFFLCNSVTLQLG